MTSIVFLNPSLSLINIPLRVFPHFVHGILDLIQDPPEFFNISLTPTCLSIICPQDTTEALFATIIADLKDGTGATIEAQEYVCMQIDGEGMSDGSRMLELTQPLAKAGISILFITTYFSDYVLVASEEMKKVRKVLLDKGFSFEDLNGSFISLAGSSKGTSVSHSLRSVHGSPPPTFDFDEDFPSEDGHNMESSTGSLADRVAQEQGLNTLQFLRRGEIPVTLSRETKLLMVGSRAQLPSYTMTLTKLFLRRELPKFFSITQAPETSPSLLLTSDLVEEFDPSTLLGVETAQVLIPITLDLSGLHSAAGLGGCGIVCGVVDELMSRAARSTSSLEQMLTKEELIMSYLSTVVTGNVLIREQDVGRLGTEEECKVM